MSPFQNTSYSLSIPTLNLTYRKSYLLTSCSMVGTVVGVTTFLEPHTRRISCRHVSKVGTLLDAEELKIFDGQGQPFIVQRSLPKLKGAWVSQGYRGVAEPGPVPSSSASHSNACSWHCYSIYLLWGVCSYFQNGKNISPFIRRSGIRTWVFQLFRECSRSNTIYLILLYLCFPYIILNLWVFSQ